MMKKILILLLFVTNLHALPIDKFITLREMIFSSLNQTNLFIVRQFENVRDNYDPRAYYFFTPKCCERHPWNLYAAPIGIQGTVHSQDHLAGYRYTMGGIISGIDYAFLNGGVGFEADYSYFSGSPFQNFGDFDVEQLHGSFYGTYIAVPNFSFDLIVGGGYDFTNLKRNSFDEVSHSRPDAYIVSGLFGGEYQLICGHFTWIPLLAVEYSAYSIGEFREFNAPDYDIFLASQSYESLRTIVGFKVNVFYEMGGFRITPQINLNWQHENMVRDRKFGMVKIGSRDPQAFFPVRGMEAEIFVGGFDLAIKGHRFFSDLSYEYECSQTYLLHCLSLQLGINF